MLLLHFFFDIFAKRFSNNCNIFVFKSNSCLTLVGTALKDLENETESIVRGIMDAFQHSMVDPIIDSFSNTSADVIIQQEEKEIDKDGNVKIKQRTLKNPTKEDLETKTLEELETDDGDDVTTMQTFRIKLTDNDISDHAFSSFALDDPKNANDMRTNTNDQASGFVKNFFWFTVKMASVLGKFALLIVNLKSQNHTNFLNCIIGAGCMIFVGYRSYLKRSNIKRRYHKNDNEDPEIDSEDDDEEELRNIREAVKRGEKNYDY